MHAVAVAYCLNFKVKIQNACVTTLRNAISIIATLIKRVHSSLDILRNISNANKYLESFL